MAAAFAVLLSTICASSIATLQNRSLVSGVGITSYLQRKKERKKELMQCNGMKECNGKKERIQWKERKFTSYFFRRRRENRCPKVASP